MMMPRPRPLLLLACALVVLACSASVAAAQCSSYATEPACYTNRTSCHWDIASNACADLAPNNATCYQYHRDTVGCAAATSGSAGLKCQVNSAWNNMCYQPLLPCASITGSDSSCKARSDCRVYPATGQCAVAVTGPSLYSNSSISCNNNGYFYDIYAPGQLPMGSSAQCYGGGLNEAVTNYPNCGLWSYYGAASGEPCLQHGCSFDALTGRCLALPVDGGASGTTAATSSLLTSFSIGSAVVDMLAQTLSVTVTVPATQFFNPVKPRWHVITVGTPPSSSPIPASPTACNNLAVAHPAFGINALAAPSYPDTYGLTALFLSSAQSTHNISQFDASTAAGAAIYQTIGRSKIGAGSVVQSVVIPSTLDQVTQVVTVSLPGAVASCGATLTRFSNYSQYTVPVSVTLRDGDNVAVSTVNQVVTLSTYGMVVVGASTRNALTTSIESLVDTSAATAYSAACPLGQKKRTWTVRETWVNPNNNTLVGLRNLSDVSMVSSGYNQIAGSPTNCFGTKPVSVTAPTFPCSNSRCVTLIQFETRCALTPSDGNGLNLCTNQLPANQAADLGATNGGVYSPTSTLNMVQSYYHYAKEWTASNPSAAINVGQDVTGVLPDQVSVSISNPTMPDAVNQAALAVDCAFLPTPNSSLASGTLVASTTGALSSSSSFNLRNFQLASSSALTTVCYLRNATLRQSFTVAIDMQTTVPANMYTVAALNAQGMLTSYSPPLHYADIQNEMLYMPRQVAPDSSKMLTLVAANVGVDGFSVPAYWLYRLLPSVGYVQQFYVSVLLPSTSNATAVVVSRRLLSTRALLQASTTDPTGSLNAGAFTIVQDANSTASASVLSVALGSTSTSIKKAAVVTAVVGGTVALGVVGAFVAASMAAAGTAAAASSGIGAIATAAAAAGTLGRARPKHYI